MKLSYEERDGTTVPRLTTEEGQAALGPFAAMRDEHLKARKPALRASLLADGALTSHLAETERLAQEMADDLTARMAASQGVDEAMKSADPMGWAAKMGAIREEARSTAIRELVFT